MELICYEKTNMGMRRVKLSALREAILSDTNSVMNDHDDALQNEREMKNS